MRADEPLMQSIDPPAGGLDGLRDRIRRRQLLRGAVTAVLMVSLTFGWFGTGEERVQEVPALVRTHPFGRLLWADAAEPVRVIGGVAVEWTGTASETRIFLVDPSIDP